MQTLVNLLTMLSQYKADFKAKEDALELACTNANHGLKPTKDVNGRLHAPCAGYIFNDSIYGAGEYLSDEHTRTSASFSTKIKVKQASVAIISQVWPVTTGAVWSENGGMVCYIYVNGLSKTQKEELEETFPSTKTKTLVLESEAIKDGLQVGKSFKLTMRGVANAWSTDSGSGCSFECYIVETGLAPLLTIDLVKGKVKFNHPYKGQMVAYHYTNPVAL